MNYVNPITATFSDIKIHIPRNKRTVGVIAVALGAITAVSSIRDGEPPVLVAAKATAIAIAVPVTALMTVALTSLAIHSSILAMQLFDLQKDSN